MQMNIWHSLEGMYRIKILGPSVLDIISAAADNNIRLYGLAIIDELHAECSIIRKDYKLLSALLLKKGASIESCSKHGIFWSVNKVLLRPILLFGLLFILFLDLYIPTRILFVQVVGNHIVPTEKILDLAEQNGVHFGAVRKDLRSEKIKNALLGSVPELQWVGVNTAGCVATISVEEGKIEKKEKQSELPSSIVANIDGIIRQITVTSGKPLCKAGQAVKKGQILVSGYADLGLMIRLADAEAEILADTQRDIRAIYPLSYIHRKEIQRKKTRYSIILGKNIIKLYNDSGISDVTCVKMYRVRRLTLPGGFCMPLGVVAETLNDCSAQDSQHTDPATLTWLRNHMSQYLNQHMVAGSIRSSEFSSRFMNGYYQLNGKFHCTEMIGNKHSEGILKSHE